eukprot:5783126-Amphidinium_carterae.1
MSEARRYYPYMFPIFLAVFLSTAALSFWALSLVHHFMSPTPLTSMYVCAILFLPTPVIAIYNHCRLHGASELPQKPPSGAFATKPLQHVFVLAAYKELRAKEDPTHSPGERSQTRPKKKQREKGLRDNRSATMIVPGFDRSRWR